MAKEHSVYELNRIQQYIMQMRPVLKKEALFSDGTKDYRNPTEPEVGEKVTIRFRTGRNNVDIVWLCTDCEHYKMKKTESDCEFDYYAVEMTMGEEPFYYYFEVASGLLHVFFDRYGVSKERRDAFMIAIWFFTLFALVTVFLFYAQELVQKLRKKDTHKKWYLCGVMAAVFGVAEMLHQSSHGEWFRDYLLYIGIPLFLFLPLFVLLWGKGKKRHEG